MREQHRDRGAAAVEFALVLPLLVALVLGIAELGRAYHVQTTLSNAARDGVRVMALQNDPVAARVAARASASPLTLSDEQISVTPASCAAIGTTSAGTATVTVTYPFRLIGGFLPIDDFTVTGQGTMRCNG
ncbi:TadE/TadG family type IV pilus assembly protein [Bogoriella caseilytica]|uniref:TadE-like protein n=1 Tax=Bogoriella caseilytica TaxID=56055 RepID=A0A3N2BDD1_9MICO|nr:TadE family protein [Bogoriella caseilytica]ROR73242.1 TadE-like protein [Bogoriella caseilytica]